MQQEQTPKLIPTTNKQAPPEVMPPVPISKMRWSRILKMVVGCILTIILGTAGGLGYVYYETKTAPTSVSVSVVTPQPAFQSTSSPRTERDTSAISTDYTAFEFPDPVLPSPTTPSTVANTPTTPELTTSDSLDSDEGTGECYESNSNEASESSDENSSEEERVDRRKRSLPFFPLRKLTLPLEMLLLNDCKNAHIPDCLCVPGWRHIRNGFVWLSKTGDYTVQTYLFNSGYVDHSKNTTNEFNVREGCYPSWVGVNAVNDYALCSNATSSDMMAAENIRRHVTYTGMYILHGQPGLVIQKQCVPVTA